MTDAQSARLSWYQATMWTRDQFYFSPRIFSTGISGFFSIRSPLWREDGSVMYPYNSYWVLPALSLLGRSPPGVLTTSYCLMWDWAVSLLSLTIPRITEEVFYPTSPLMFSQQSLCSCFKRLSPGTLREHCFQQFCCGVHVCWNCLTTGLQATIPSEWYNVT
jgi:hypothetical protein